MKLTHRLSVHALLPHWKLALASCALVLVQVSSVLATPYSDLINSHGPVAYWKLDETSGTSAIDQTGNFHGTLQGPTRGPAGPGRNNPRSVNFDGVNDYINCGTPNITGSAITVAAWIRPDDFDVANARILSKKRIWTVLLVVGNPAAMTTQETMRFYGADTLLGWRVNTIAASATQAAFDAAVAAADVVYITEDVSGATLATKLRGAIAGVVNEDREQVAPLGFAASSTVIARNAINVVTRAHPITAAQPLGNLTIANSSQQLLYLNAPLAAGATNLAEVSGADLMLRPSLVAINAGGALHGGGTAAARRVQLMLGGDTFDITSLNTAGQTLTGTSLMWAAGQLESGAETNRHYWTLSTRVASGTPYLSFMLKAGGSTSTLDASQGPLTAAKWVFVTGVYDGSRMILYKDGVEVASMNKSGTLDDGAYVPLWIGDQPEKTAGSSAARPFDGLIDEVAIFNKALTPAEIRGLYLVGVSRGVRVRKWEEIR